MTEFEFQEGPALEGRPKRGRKTKQFNGTDQDKKYLDEAIAGISAGFYRGVEQAAYQITKKYLGESEKTIARLKRNLKKHFSITNTDR